MLRLGGEAGDDEVPILSNCRKGLLSVLGGFFGFRIGGFGGLCDFLALSGRDWDGMG